MSRRHLESALVAGAFLESGLTPCFRFTRVRYARRYFPPCYTIGYELEPTLEPPRPVASSRSDSITLTCTCPGIGEVDNNMEETDEFVEKLLASGDCKDKDVESTRCRLHMSEYLDKHPEKRLLDDYAIHSVQFTADGKQLLAGGANTSVRVIETAGGAQRLLPRPSKWALGMPITTIRFMPPKSYWALGCTPHGEVFAFNPEQEGFETLFKEPQQTYTFDISPDGLEMATGGSDRKIRIYTLQTSELVGMPRETPENIKYRADSVTGSIIQKLNVVTGDSQFQVSKLIIDPEPRYQFPGGRPDQIVDLTCKLFHLTRCYGTSDLSRTPEQPEPAAYYQGKTVVPPLKEYIPTSPGINITEGHSKRIMALRYHPDRPNLLISAGWDNLVKIWDTRLYHGPIAQIFGPHVASPDGIDIDDNYLLTASWRARQSLEIWDLRTVTSERRSSSSVQSRPVTPNENLVSFATKPSPPGPAEVIPISGGPWVSYAGQENGEYLYAARLLPSRAVVAAGSGFQEVRVVNRDTLLPIAQIPVDSVVQSMDCILEGRYIGVGCSSGTVSIIALG